MPVFAPRGVKRRMRTHFVMNAKPLSVREGSPLRIVKERSSTPGQTFPNYRNRPKTSGRALFDSFFGITSANPILGLVQGLMFEDREKRKRDQMAMRQNKNDRAIERHQHRGS